jgi:hypothetical protein
MSSEATASLRQARRLAAGLGQTMERLSMPLLLLGGRLWLGPIALVG